MAIAAIAIILLIANMDGKAQSPKKVKAIIQANGDDFMRWFNTGEVDSLLTLYRDDACLLALGCGKELISTFYQSQVTLYKFEEFRILSVSVCDSVAVEKGNWTVSLESGGVIRGQYLTEWRRTGKKWLIVNDISDNY